MKKILLGVITFILSISGAFAYDSNYSYSRLDSEIAEYKVVIESKLGDKLDNFTEKDYEKLFILVDGYEMKYLNDSNITEELKIKNISMLKAIKLITMEGLGFKEDHFAVIEIGLFKAKSIKHILLFDSAITFVESKVELFEERNLFENKTRTTRMQIERLKESFGEVQLIKK